MNKLDHLLWAAPDLDAAITTMQNLSGATVHPGGSHPGNGSRNALLGLDHKTYLEIIAPDPAQELAGTMGELMSALPKPTLYTFAVACAEFEITRTRLQNIGLEMKKPVASSRALDDGSILEWEIAVIVGHQFGPLVPFLINWGVAPHPSASLSPECTLDSFTISHSNSAGIKAVMEALEVDIPCNPGIPGLHASFTTPKGDVLLES